MTAQTASFVSDVDDAYAAILELEGGALATLESSRVASGWKGRHRIELNGSDGSIWWDMEDPNRLHVFLFADERERDRRLPRRDRDAAGPPVPGAVVAAGARARVGAQLRPPMA